MGSISCQETKIPHAMQLRQPKEREKKKKLLLWNPTSIDRKPKWGLGWVVMSGVQ